MKPRTLRKGQRIRIPWGLDEVDATVLDIVVRNGERGVILLIELKGDAGVPDELLKWQFPEATLLAATG